MRSTFNILFYINRTKQKKDGKCPILGRITVDGKSTQFSIQEAIEPNLWSVEKSCSIAKDKEAKALNLKLEQYQTALKQHYNRLVEDNAYVTAESLKNALLGIGTHETMLLKEFQAHNDEYAKSVGITKSKGSYFGYVHAYKALQKFVTQKYGLDDIAFKELQCSFIEDYEFFLSVNLNFAPNTVMNVILKLKRIIHRAINKEIIRKNPFADYKCKQGESNRKWLSKAELDILMQTPMKEKKTELVRVLFLFLYIDILSNTHSYNILQIEKIEHVNQECAIFSYLTEHYAYGKDLEFYYYAYSFQLSVKPIKHQFTFNFSFITICFIGQKAKSSRPMQSIFHLVSHALFCSNIYLIINHNIHTIVKPR